MTVLTYAIVVIVILGFCVLGLSIGLLVRNKGLSTCGRASAAMEGHDVSCPACSGKAEDCKKKT